MVKILNTKFKDTKFSIKMRMRKQTTRRGFDNGSLSLIITKLGHNYRVLFAKTAALGIPTQEELAAMDAKDIIKEKKEVIERKETNT